MPVYTAETISFMDHDDVMNSIHEAGGKILNIESTHHKGCDNGYHNMKEPPYTSYVITYSIDDKPKERMNIHQTSHEKYVKMPYPECLDSQIAQDLFLSMDASISIKIAQSIKPMVVKVNSGRMLSEIILEMMGVEFNFKVNSDYKWELTNKSDVSKIDELYQSNSKTVLAEVELFLNKMINQDTIHEAFHDYKYAEFLKEFEKHNDPNEPLLRMILGMFY